jgi:anti-repressor protein
MQVNELITVSTNDKQQPIVSGRALHEFLEVGTEYAKWFDRMAEYGFSDGTDFSSVLAESTGGRPATDHALTLDMAKELCMLQRTDKGKQARQYFIQVEKDFNSPEKVMARALKIADEELRTVKAQLQIAAPKAEFYDAVTASDDLLPMDRVAKLLNIGGIGRNMLFRILRNRSVLRSNNDPYQEYVDRGYFTLRETRGYYDRNDEYHPTYKTYATQKGLDWIRRMIVGGESA